MEEEDQKKKKYGKNQMREDEELSEFIHKLNFVLFGICSLHESHQEPQSERPQGTGFLYVQVRKIEINYKESGN